MGEKVKSEKISIDNNAYKKYERAYQYAMDMTLRECHQAVEGMYHNLNTLQSRSGNQLPFTSINYGTCTLPEGRMIIKELLDVSIEGLGKFGRTSIFPCSIFQLMEGVNRKPGDLNYDMYLLALKSTAQRLYPNYCNAYTTMNNIQADRDLKQSLIDALSDVEKQQLMQSIEEHPELGEFLNIKVIDE